MAAEEGDVLDRLASHVARNPRHGDRNHAIFVALKDDIRRGLEGGYKMRVVWELFREEGKIEMGYDTFRGYCRKYDLAPQRRRRGARKGGKGPGSGGSGTGGGASREPSSMSERLRDASKDPFGDDV